MEMTMLRKIELEKISLTVNGRPSTCEIFSTPLKAKKNAANWSGRELPRVVSHLSPVSAESQANRHVDRD
jgi:hypothetical protein